MLSLKILVLLLMTCVARIEAQESFRIYNVRYKGENIGVMQLQQSINGDTINYKMTSDIRARFIFLVTVKSVEESSFQHGKLMYSTVNRTINGNEKVKRQTRSGNSVYTLSKEGKPGIIHLETINYNLMRLYCLEPTGISKVYSDNHQEFLPIIKIKPHTYKIELPDGNYNYYSYNNGICVKVEVFSSLYNMEMVLR